MHSLDLTGWMHVCMLKCSLMDVQCFILMMTMAYQNNNNLHLCRISSWDEDLFLMWPWERFSVCDRTCWSIFGYEKHRKTIFSRLTSREIYKWSRTQILRCPKDPSILSVLAKTSSEFVQRKTRRRAVPFSGLPFMFLYYTQWLISLFSLVVFFFFFLSAKCFVDSIVMIFINEKKKQTEFWGYSVKVI